MGRPSFEGRGTGRRERLRPEREVANEPGEVNEVARPRVLDGAGEGQGMELLGDMLVHGIDGEPPSLEAEALDDWVGQAGLELADDEVGGADVDLEADKLRRGAPRGRSGGRRQVVPRARPGAPRPRS